MSKNKLLFWANSVKIGKNSRILGPLYLRICKNGSMFVGDNFTFTSGNGINPISRNIRGIIFIDRNAKIIIGNDTGISSSCLWAKCNITIGNRVKIGGNCLLLDTDCHNLDYRIRNGNEIDEYGNRLDCSSASSIPIHIMDDVLVGANSIILKGVTIGERSIIAAGSVVAKSIPADCIAGGNPCKIIRYINE